MFYLFTQGKRNHTEVDYARAYPSSLENIKSEPGLQQDAVQRVKMELTEPEYMGDYYAGGEDNSYDDYDMYYDQSAGMFTDHGGLFSTTGHFPDDASHLMEHSRPGTHKVLLAVYFNG